MKHTVREVQLKNGARGLFIDVPGATVTSFEINFVAGDVMTPKNKWDTAHLMEHLVLGGNEKIKNGRAYNAELEKNGAATNAYTGLEYVGYWAECADFEWERVLDLLLAGISKPLFLREEFKAEFGNVKDELTAYTNDHFSHLNSESRQAYGLLDATDRERLKQLRNIRRVDVINHYQKTHTTSNLRFIIGGNLRGRRAVIERMFEKLSMPKGRGRFSFLDEKPQAIQKPLIVSRPSVKNTHFYLHTFALERIDDKHRDALWLVNNMLTATLHSRILGEAREKGLVYHVGSHAHLDRSYTSWRFGAQVLPKNAPALFEIIVRELLRVKAGDISAEDLESAKQYAIGRYQRSGQTVGGVIAGYSGRYFYDGVIEDYQAFPSQIKAITKKSVVEAVNRMFVDKVGGLSLLGNSKTRELSEPLFESIQPLWND